MAEEDSGHPILYGLVAFIAVSLAIGGILGGAALVGARATGLNGGTIETENSATQSLYLPSPSPTETPTAPLVTIGPNDPPVLPTPTGEPTGEQLGTQISLAVGGTSFSPGDKISLTGTYAAGEGVALAVQRLEGDVWSNFSDVTARVTDGTFGTFIYTEREGEAQFRVYDADSDRASNVVTLTIG